jgi:hypothetical protein
MALCASHGFPAKGRAAANSETAFPGSRPLIDIENKMEYRITLPCKVAGIEKGVLLTHGREETIGKSKRAYSRAKTVLPCLLLLVPVLVAFRSVLSGRLILVERDLGTYFIPPRFLWVKLARSFTFPFWNPHNYSGIPLLATLQPGVLYPPHLLYLFLPFNVVWNWLIILHYLFAGITTYLLLRHFNATRAASFAGAVTFAFSGYLFSLHSLVTHLFAASWFPLVILFFLRYLDAAKARHLVLTAVCLCMVFLSGAPEVLLMTLFALALMTLFGPGQVHASLALYGRIKAFCLTCLLFGLLSAVQLLPFLELKSASIREGGLSYWEATLWSFGFKDFIQFFVNDAFGAFRNLDRYWQNQAWLKSVYTGIGPFVLSAFFFLSKDRRRLLFLALMLLSLVLALGGNTPLYRLLYHVPPFDGLRYPVKFLFLFVFFLALTTGLGLDSIGVGDPEKERRRGRAMLIVLAAGVFFALLWAYASLFHAQAYHLLDAGGFRPDAYNVIGENLKSMRRFLLFSSLVCFCLPIYFRTRRSVLLYVTIFLLFLDLFLANFGDFRTTPWQTYAAPPPFAESLGGPSSLDRYVVDASAAEEFYAFPHNRAILAPTYAGVFGLHAASGSEVMKVAHQEAFLELIKKSPSIEAARGLLGAAGIRYVITLRRIDDRGFRLIRRISAESAKRKKGVTVYLYEYVDCPDRVFLVSKACFVDSDADAAKALGRKDADPRKELVLHGRTARLSEGGVVSGRARIVEYTPNRVGIEYSADRDCFLYLGDTYYPGWRAYIDGRRALISRANLAFRALSVPKGTHRVVFRYVPLSFYGGLVLTLAGIGLSVFLMRKEKKNPPEGTQSAMNGE